MTGKRRLIMWTATMIAAMVMVAVILLTHPHTRPMTLRGAVIQQDTDPTKELPLADVEIKALSSGVVLGDGTSDASGSFTVTLRTRFWIGRAITLQFRHADYEPLDLKEFVGDKLYIAHMVPLRHEEHVANRPDIVVSNVLARYSIKTTNTANVGSAVKTFEVVNKGNVPCQKRPPCSPDGQWKAAIGSATLDAGEGNEFRNARTSCIAGPCPFTKIEAEDYLQGGREVKVSARNWSDTATFLLEAEVFRPMVSDMVRMSHPVKFGQALNFTVPGSAEGVSIQAEINGDTITFPFGPNLYLSWADCNARVNRDQTKVYRCELKPGYKFR
ncbi:MAG: hypothetical protein ACRD20_04855 [Terriglobales bacterium]